MTYASGVPFWAQPGDWIITVGDTLIEILNDRLFREKYEPVVEGTLIPKSTCTAIEAVTGIGTTRTHGELLAAITRLARIAIGTIEIDFTPGQLEEIARRATKRGYTVKQEFQRIVDRIKDEIFYKS